MNFFSLPPELRGLVYTFCFPPPQSRVQLIPYYRRLPICHLHLPLSLYLVCKRFYQELPSLPSTLRTLDLLYIIEGRRIEDAYCPSDGPRRDDDHPHLLHFKSIMQYAERVRLVGGRTSCTTGRGRRHRLVRHRKLAAGPECALRVLEVQPIGWNKRACAKSLVKCFTALTAHPDVAERLKVRLIRDTEGDPNAVGEAMLDRAEEWLQYYQGLDAAQRRQLE